MIKEVDEYKQALTRLFVTNARDYYTAYESSPNKQLDFNTRIASNRTWNTEGLKEVDFNSDVSFSTLKMPASIEGKIAHLSKFWNEGPTSKFNERIPFNYYCVLLDVVLDYIAGDSTSKGAKTFDLIRQIVEAKATLVSELEKYDNGGGKVKPEQFHKASQDVLSALEKKNGDIGDIISRVKVSSRFFINLHAKTSVDSLSYFLWNVFGKEVKNGQYDLTGLQTDSERVKQDPEAYKRKQDDYNKASQSTKRELTDNFELFQYTLFYQLSIVWIVYTSFHREKDDKSNKWFSEHQLPSMMKMFRSNPLLNDAVLDKPRAMEFMKTFAARCKEFMESVHSTPLFEMLDPSAAKSPVTLSEALDKCHAICKAHGFEVFDLLGWDLFSLKDPIRESARTLVKKAGTGQLSRELKLLVEQGEFEALKLFVPYVDKSQEDGNDSGSSQFRKDAATAIMEEDNKKSIESLKEFAKSTYPAEYGSWLSEFNDPFEALKSVLADPKYAPMIEEYQNYMSKYDLTRLQEIVEEEAKNAKPEDMANIKRFGATDRLYRNKSEYVMSKLRLSYSRERLQSINRAWDAVLDANTKIQELQKEARNVHYALYPYIAYNFFSQTPAPVSLDNVRGFYVEIFHDKFPQMYANGLLYRYGWARMFSRMVKQWKSLKTSMGEKKKKKKQEEGTSSGSGEIIAAMNASIESELEAFGYLGSAVDPFQLYTLYYRRDKNILDQDPIFAHVSKKEGIDKSQIDEFMNSGEYRDMLMAELEANITGVPRESAIGNVLTLSFSAKTELKDVVLPFEDPEVHSNDWNAERKRKNAETLLSYLTVANKREGNQYQMLRQSLEIIHGIELSQFKEDIERGKQVDSLMYDVASILHLRPPAGVRVIDYTLDYLIAHSARKKKSSVEVKRITEIKGLWSKSYLRYFKKKEVLSFESMIEPCLDFGAVDNIEDASKVQLQALSRVFWTAISESTYAQLLFLTSPEFLKRYDAHKERFTNNLMVMINQSQLNHFQLLNLGRMQIYLSMIEDARKKGFEGFYEFEYRSSDNTIVSRYSKSAFDFDLSSAQKELVSHLEAVTTLATLFDIDPSINLAADYAHISSAVSDINNVLTMEDAMTSMGYTMSVKVLTETHQELYDVLVLMLEKSKYLAVKVFNMAAELSSEFKDRTRRLKILSASGEQLDYSPTEYLFPKAIICSHPIYESQLEWMIPSIRRKPKGTPSSLFKEELEIKGSVDNNKTSKSVELPSKVFTHWSDLGLLLDTREYFNSLQWMIMSYNTMKAKSSASDSRVFDLRVFKEHVGLQRKFATTKANRITSTTAVPEATREDIRTTIESIYNSRIDFTNEVTYGYYTLVSKYREFTQGRAEEYVDINAGDDDEDWNESNNNNIDEKDEERSTVNHYELDFEFLAPKIQSKASATSLTKTVLETKRAALVQSYKIPLWRYKYDSESTIRLWSMNEAQWSSTGRGRKNCTLTPLQENRKVFSKEKTGKYDPTKLDQYFYVATNDGFVDPEFEGNENSRENAFDWTMYNVSKAVSDLRSNLSALDKAAASRTDEELWENVSLLTASALSLVVIMADTWNPMLTIQLIDEMISFSHTDSTGKVVQRNFKESVSQCESEIADLYNNGRLKIEYNAQLRALDAEYLLEYLGVTKGRLKTLSDKGANASRDITATYANFSQYVRETLMETVLGLKNSLVVELNRFMTTCLQNTELKGPNAQYKTRVEFTEPVQKEKKSKAKSTEDMDIDGEDKATKSRATGDSVKKIKSVNYSMNKNDNTMFGLHIIVRSVWGDYSRYDTFNTVNLNIGKIVSNALRLVDMAIESEIYIPDAIKPKASRKKGQKDNMEM